MFFFSKWGRNKPDADSDGSNSENVFKRCQKNGKIKHTKKKHETTPEHEQTRKLNVNKRLMKKMGKMFRGSTPKKDPSKKWCLVWMRTSPQY